jgi:hypothetical protein
MTDIVTADLSKFGYRELNIAGKLIQAYSEQPVDFLGNGLTINFNTHSGYVFLSDEDYNVGMLDEDGNLKQWFFCPECGQEGFDSPETPFATYDGYCSQQCREKNS